MFLHETPMQNRFHSKGFDCDSLLLRPRTENLPYSVSNNIKLELVLELVEIEGIV